MVPQATCPEPDGRRLIGPGSELDDRFKKEISTGPIDGFVDDVLDLAVARGQVFRTSADRKVRQNDERSSRLGRLFDGLDDWAYPWRMTRSANGWPLAVSTAATGFTTSRKGARSPGSSPRQDWPGRSWGDDGRKVASSGKSVIATSHFSGIYPESTRYRPFPNEPPMPPPTTRPISDSDRPAQSAESERSQLSIMSGTEHAAPDRSQLSIMSGKEHAAPDRSQLSIIGPAYQAASDRSQLSIMGPAYQAVSDRSQLSIINPVSRATPDRSQLSIMSPVYRTAPERS